MVETPIFWGFARLLIENNEQQKRDERAEGGEKKKVREEKCDLVQNLGWLGRFLAERDNGGRLGREAGRGFRAGFGHFKSFGAKRQPR